MKHDDLTPHDLIELFWLLAAVVIFQMIRKQNPKLLLWMIPVLGLGWLNKYSIIFYGSALLAAMIISRNRKLLWSWALPLTLAGGLLVILPNLLWQFQHNWPVISHMGELQPIPCWWSSEPWPGKNGPHVQGASLP